MTAILDIIEGQLTQDKNGYRHERYAIVQSVTGNADQRMYNALQDAQLPAYGDNHPTIPNITLNKKTASIIDPENIKVTLSYYFYTGQKTGSSNATVRVSAGTTIEEKKTDINGNTMQSQYTVTEGLTSTTYYPTFKTEVEIPRLTFDFEYIVAAFPKTTIDAYHGKINSLSWNGYGVNTILCVAVNVDQQGDEYSIRISFVYNPDKWQFIAKVAKAPSIITGTTDTNLNTTTGLKTFDIYQETDFSPLGFVL